jgi:hypothetical protein
VAATVAVVLGFALLRALSPFDSGTASAAWTLALDGVVWAALIAAATAFAPGDPPRAGWITIALSEASIVTAHALRLVGSSFDPVIIVANGLWILCIVQWVRTFGRSMLAPEWTRRARVVVAVLVLLAVATAAATLWIELSEQWALPSAERKQPWAIARGTASTLADAGAFIGATFLVRLLWPMSGGAIVRPYLLLCISAALYLGLDLAIVITGLASYAALDGVLSNAFALADGSVMAAGVSQAVLIRRRGR